MSLAQYSKALKDWQSAFLGRMRHLSGLFSSDIDISSLVSNPNVPLSKQPNATSNMTNGQKAVGALSNLIKKG